MITIIIDRVNQTNVFNVIRDSTVVNPVLREDENFISHVDDDLIMEFIEGLRHIVQLGRSIHSIENNSGQERLFFNELNLTNRLKNIGQAFFRQFFPSSLHRMIAENRDEHIYFDIDPALSSIPFELFHDGDDFFLNKFYLGKMIKGYHQAFVPVKTQEIIKIAIIADPTENLPWAKKEGESLYDFISEKFSDKKLNIDFIGGSSITKLDLLNIISDKDIIHYAGHLHFAASPKENGWILPGGKILHAREIEKSGAHPVLIFSNSCLSAANHNSQISSADWFSKFASSFINSGRTNYIGTLWEIEDSESLLLFTLDFYHHLLSGNTIGESLQKARKYAMENFSIHNIIWAAYSLMGNPEVRLTRSISRLPDFYANILNEKEVIREYPFPIAQAYHHFREVTPQENTTGTGEANPQLMENLFQLVSETISFLAAIILGNYKMMKIGEDIVFPYPEMRPMLDAVYKILNRLKSIKANLLVPNLLDIAFVHKDNLYKIADFSEEFYKDKNAFPQNPSYEITIQYMLETLLIDLSILKRYGLYIIIEPGYRQLSLKGTSEYHILKDIILPTQDDISTHEELIEKTRPLIGKCVFYHPVRKTFIDLSPFIEISMEETDVQEKGYVLKFSKIE